MIKTGNPVISIYTEMTPNPETMKFVANKLLYPGKSIDFPDVEAAKPSPLAIELFGFPFIKSVFIASNFVTLTKTSETEWNDVIPTIRQFLKEYLEEGKAVINEDEVASIKPESSNLVSADDDDVVKRIKELLENYVKPAVEMDGGAIQFKSCKPDVARVLQRMSFVDDHAQGRYRRHDETHDPRGKRSGCRSRISTYTFRKHNERPFHLERFFYIP